MVISILSPEQNDQNHEYDTAKCISWEKFSEVLIKISLYIANSPPHNQSKVITWIINDLSQSCLYSLSSPIGI